MILMALTPVLSAVAETPLTDTRHWLEHALEEEMAKQPAERWDWNLVASVTFPLARHYHRHRIEETRELLERTARRIDGVDATAMECGKLADLYLTGRFLEEAGIPLQRQPERQRLAACLAEAPEFDRANALLLACRYGAPVERAFVEEAATKLVAGQLEDGAFTEKGKSGYYLTSHAMLALHECGGHDQAVARAADKLARHLEPFLRRGFLDGAAESLIFLRWVGRPVDNEAAYIQTIRRWTTPDGGLCFNLHPGCEAHWHATALLLELLDLPR